MTSHCVLTRVLFTLACFLLPAVPALAGDDWGPVDPAHLALKAPVVEPDADAEAIFWDVQVDFTLGKTVFANYVRIKIFTERGKELRGKIELRYSSKNKIEDIAGRTIKADGTIVELKQDAIFDSTLVKLRRLKINAKTFAMPAVEPGVIIEYRWREVRHDSSGYFARLSFQRDIPIQLVKYTLKTSSDSVLGFRTKAFNMANPPMAPEKDKRFSYSMTNVHAFHDEPHMPPEDQVRFWMLAYYQPPLSLDFDKVVYDEYRSKTKVNDEIRRAAQAAIGDASTPDQKLERLFDFCRTKIKNINDDASGLTGDDLAKLKENKTAADTLKRGMGTGEDIDLLFGALAIAAGFDARVAHLADRSDIFFNPNEFEFLLNLYFMRSYNIAVRGGNGWRFYDPASRYVPLGMLRWQEEGGKAMIVDPTLALFAVTPLSPAERSLQKRTANLRLIEDGTLEGDVRMEYTGHFAVEKKEENDEESVEQREKSLRDMIKEQMSTAELSGIRIENVVDPVKPFVYSFHVRVPGYAQRTGKRLFLQPAFFQKGILAMFSASTRKHGIYFHYSWMEDDTVTIDLPAGFALDNADAPQPFSARNVADYKVKISVVGKGEALQYRRTFSFDGVIFPASSYSGLKLLFDALYLSDNHTITLKQNAASQ
jgi:hypothetical protein